MRDLPIAPLPDFVRFCGAVDAAPTNMTDTTARETPPPLEVTVSALKYCRARKEATCDRGVWLETLAAMKFSYGEAGRDATDEWSETADNFDAEVQDATWDLLKRASGKVKTAASIVWRARQKGWTAIDIEFADIFEAAANENQGSEPTSGAGAAQTGQSSTQPPAFEVRAYEWTEAETDRAATVARAQSSPYTRVRDRHSFARRQGQDLARIGRSTRNGDRPATVG